MAGSEWTLLEQTLRAPLNAAELEDIEKTGHELTERLLELNRSGRSLNIAALQTARLQASNTLRKDSAEIQHWQNALTVFNEHLFAQKPLTLDLLEKWNRCLRDDFSASPAYRLEDLFLCEKKLIPASLVTGAMKDFENFVLTQNEDVILNASRVYQWLITIHPFPNANGRTARLAADYILMSNGYLPLVFPSPQGSFVAISPDHPHAISPLQSFHRVSRAIERSIEILQLPNEDSAT